MSNISVPIHKGQTPLDAPSIAFERSQQTAELSKRMRNAAKGARSTLAFRCSKRLYKCSEPSNHWIGYGLLSKEGKTFDGQGTFYHCGLPYCPSCAVVRSSQNKARLRELMPSVSLRPNEKWRLFTLTGPVVESVSLFAVMRVYLRAFELLRKRQCFKTRIRAGARSFEFTENYRGHIHLLATSSWFAQADLAWVWSDCLNAAWSEQGISIRFNTPHNKAICDVRLIVNADPGKEAITIDDAVRRVVTYICKGSEWAAVKDPHLVEIAEVKRWPRLFDTFGEARKRNQTDSTSLDIRQLNDGKNKQRKPGSSTPIISRRRHELEGAFDDPIWKEQLDVQIERTTHFRKGQLKKRHPRAMLHTLDGEVFNDPDKTTTELIGEGTDNKGMGEAFF